MMTSLTPCPLSRLDKSEEETLARPKELFSGQEAVLRHVSHSDEESSMQTFCRCPAGSQEVEHSWNENELFLLHTDLFYSSLDALRSLTSENASEKQEILDWIFEPDVVIKMVKGLKVVVFSLDVPFSFVRCCKMLGYQPDLIRSGLEERVRARQIR